MLFTSNNNTTTKYPSMLECPTTIRPLVNMERSTSRWRSNIELAPNCPRCASTNTKFCYYNNYSLSQPRYFCKGCRRYWTKGGSLRNVPVGGGCRKTRRSRSTRQQIDRDTVSGGQTRDQGHDNEAQTGSEIDMAAVFAKYLSHDNGENESSSSPGASSMSSELASSSLEMDCLLEDVMFDYYCQKTLDMGENNGVILPELCTLPNEENDNNVIQEIMDHQNPNNNNGFELQSIIEDHELQVAQGNFLWSDGTNLHNFACQQQQEEEEEQVIGQQHHLQQDFGLFSSNLVSENYWGLFDVSGYEIFSRP